MDARGSLQIMVKPGRPAGRRTTRSRTLDDLKRMVCEEVRAEIFRRRLTDADIDRMLGRHITALAAIRAGDWTSVGPDILLCLIEKLSLPVIAKIEHSVLTRTAA